MGDTGDSGNFIFTRGEDGHLNYAGDFDGLYRAMHDPWGQSGEHPRMKEYYAYSRTILVGTLQGLHWSGTGWHRLLEVGCGSGYVVDCIKNHQPKHVVHGCDISHAAVERAWARFPTRFFFRLDITGPVEDYHFHRANYDVVILSQILWYVLADLPSVFHNCSRLLTPGGRLIIQTAFLDNQEYGKDTVDGFHGLIRWVLDHAPGWQIVGSSYDATSQHAPHHDGILVLRAPHEQR